MARAERRHAGVLGTDHQTYSKIHANANVVVEYDGEDKVKLSGGDRNPQLSFQTDMQPGQTNVRLQAGNFLRNAYQDLIKYEIKISVKGRVEDFVDYVVYGLGQDAKMATDYISENIKGQLVPIFDKNQRFGNVTAGVLGFQSQNYKWETGKNVQQSLMVVGALAAQVANDVPMTKAKDTALKEIAEMIESTRWLLHVDVGTNKYVINATTASVPQDQRNAWKYFLYDDYQDNNASRYGKQYVEERMVKIKEFLRDNCEALRTFNLEAYKNLEHRSSALANLLCSYSSVAKDFDEQMANITKRYKDKPERANAKFWQALLDSPSGKMTSSQAGSAQILGILSAMAAINGFTPNFVQREQQGQGKNKSWADVVSANQDDRTALRIVIAVCYPLVPEEKAMPIIERVIAMKKIRNGGVIGDETRNGFGVRPQDMDQFHNELILASTQLRDANEQQVSKLKGVA